MATRKPKRQSARRTKPAAHAMGLLKPLGWTAGVLAALLAAFWWLAPGSNQSGALRSAPSPAGSISGIPLEKEGRVFARYAGSQRCRACHPSTWETVMASNHGLAERPVRPEIDREAFEPARRFRHGSQHSEARIVDGEFRVETLGFEGKRGSYGVRRVIGNDPLRQFLIPQPGGRFQTLEVAYDPHKKDWFDVYGDEDRRPGEWGHWTGRGMTWNTMCASCHNTRVRKNYNETTDTFHTTMAEMSVGCEACHGPMKAHAQWHRRHPGAPYAGDRKPYSKAQIVDTCGSCHSRRMELTGDFKPGDAYWDHFHLTIVDGSDVYYPDGQVREEDYEFASFLSSRMHAAGVTCLDCHDPHSGKTLLPGNQLCMRCHGGGYPKSPIIDPARHTFHPPESEGALCTGCHMPRTTYMQRHRRHDHGFTIPDPLLTIRHGIPNACNRCHQDHDAAWALATVEKWYGDRMDRPTRRRAESIAAARRGDASARDALIAWLKGKDTDYWKAVAANLLSPWADQPPVTEALVEALDSPSPLVRENAIQGLSPLVGFRGSDMTGPIRALLSDPARSVRFQAAWALRATLDPDSRPAKELGHALDINTDQPAGQLQKATFAVARGHLDEAVEHYRRAIGWDPNSAPLYSELAVVLSMQGRHQEALQQLQEACRRDPGEPEYPFRLALAYNEVHQLDRAVQMLEKTVKLDPRHGRAWYNLGLARNQQGHPEEALSALVRGESAQPNDPSIPYARATILLQLGRIRDARTAARRALEIQNDYSPARNLLLSLPPAP